MEEKDNIFMTEQQFEYYVLKLKEVYEFYQQQFKNKIFTLYLSDGNKIEIKIGENQLAHLLGLFIKTIESIREFQNAKNSIEIMKMIMENPNRYYKKFKYVHQNNQVTSRFWEDKVKSFLNLKKLDAKNIYFFASYDDEISVGKRGFHGNTKYVIGFKKNDKYHILGLASTKEGFYIPVTNVTLKKWEMPDYFRKQILIPISYSTENNIEITFLSQTEKEEKLKKLKELKKEGKFSAIDASNNFMNNYIEKRNHVFCLHHNSVKQDYNVYRFSEDFFIHIAKQMGLSMEKDNILLEKSLLSLNNSDLELLKLIYLNKYPLKKLASIYGCQNSQSLKVKIKIIYEHLLKIYKGLVIGDTYSMLLCSRNKLTESILELENQKRDLMLMKYSLMDCKHYNQKEMMKNLNLNLYEYRKLEEQAIKELQEKSKVYKKS